MPAFMPDVLIPARANRHVARATLRTCASPGHSRHHIALRDDVMQERYNAIFFSSRDDSPADPATRLSNQRACSTRERWRHLQPEDGIASVEIRIVVLIL